MSERRFDPETHRYWVGCVEYPSVTAILRDFGLDGAGPWFKQEHRDRGHYVHLVCEYIDQGVWDPEETSQELTAYGRAYERFKADYGFQPDPEVIERDLYSDTYRLAGTVDRWGHMPEHGRVVLDLKSGALGAAVHLQTALYALLVQEDLGLDTDKRFAVQLIPDADPPYKVRQGNGRDLGIGLSAVNLWWWKQNNHLLRART